jgi:serine/threonine protein kinase
VPEDAKDFINKILVLDPKKRPTLDELLDHPFMQKKDEIKYLPIEAYIYMLYRLNEIPNFKNLQSQNE